MNKFMLLTSLMIFVSVIAFSIHSDEEKINECEGKVGFFQKDSDQKNHCSCHKKNEGDDFFCRCTALIRAPVSRISFVAPTKANPGNQTTTQAEATTTIVNFNIPFLGINNGARGFGDGFSVCTQPLFDCCGGIMAPAGRINLNKHGTFLITFDGLAEYNTSSTDTNVPSVILKSNILPDFVVGILPLQLNGSFTGPYHFYAEQEFNICCESTCGTIPYIFLEVG